MKIKYRYVCTHTTARERKKEKERNCATFFFPLSGNKKKEEERRYLGVTSTKTRQGNLLFVYCTECLYKFRTVIVRE